MPLAAGVRLLLRRAGRRTKGLILLALTGNEILVASAAATAALAAASAFLRTLLVLGSLLAVLAVLAGATMEAGLGLLKLRRGARQSYLQKPADNLAGAASGGFIGGGVVGLLRRF